MYSSRWEIQFSQFRNVSEFGGIVYRTHKQKKLNLCLSSIWPYSLKQQSHTAYSITESLFDRIVVVVVFLQNRAYSALTD